MLLFYSCKIAKGVQEKWTLKERVHKMEKGCYSENTLQYLCVHFYVNPSIKAHMQTQQSLSSKQILCASEFY